MTHLRIEVDGEQFFDGEVDEANGSHSVTRQIDMFDMDPKLGTVTVTATYKIAPKPFDEWPSKTILDSALRQIEGTPQLGRLLDPTVGN